MLLIPLEITYVNDTPVGLLEVLENALCGLYSSVYYALLSGRA